MKPVVDEALLILFYGAQVLTFVFMIRDQKKEWFSWHMIGINIGCSVVVPFIYYAFIGEVAHYSAMIALFVIGIFVKGKTMEN